jgi:hypothetical protein
MKRFALVCSLGIGVLAGVPSTSAQTREDGAPAGAAPVGSAVGTAPVVTLSAAERDRLLLGPLGNRLVRSGRDPFSTTKKMEAIGGEGRFVAGGAGMLPKISLRGYAEPRGKPAVALVEIEGQGVYVVHAGETIGVTLAGKNTALKVQAVEAASVRVEAGSLGQVLVVR